jgi:polyisoprenoid-binding protein YceI
MESCMRPIVTFCAALVLVAAAIPGFAEEQATPAASTAPIPAGAYKLDKPHASLLFRVDHLGFSKYTGRFSSFDAQLQFDPANPAASSVQVTIDPRSLQLENPPEGFIATLLGAQWLDAEKFPQMSFRSTRVARSGTDLRIDGEMTLHGATQPMTLVAKFNGGYAGHPYDPNARIGFSARGTLKRSAFGVAFGIPAPGTTMGVSDAVEVIVEAEFTGPPLPKK